jgi:Zinc finger found in FPG and IleRS
MDKCQDQIFDNETSQRIKQLIKDKNIRKPKVFVDVNYKKESPSLVYFTGSIIVVEPASLSDLTVKCTVKRAEGAKCDRCWNFSLSVGTFPHRPLLCDRCIEVIDRGIVDGDIAIDHDGYFWVADRPFTDFEHLPMHKHIDYWCGRFGEDYRAGLSVPILPPSPPSEGTVARIP